MPTTMADDAETTAPARTGRGPAPAVMAAAVAIVVAGVAFGAALGVLSAGSDPPSFDVASTALLVVGAAVLDACFRGVRRDAERDLAVAAPGEAVGPALRLRALGLVGATTTELGLAAALLVLGARIATGSAGVGVVVLAAVPPLVVGLVPAVNPVLRALSRPGAPRGVRR